MSERYFKGSWLLPCSLRSHRIVNPTPKNGLRHFSALPTHHPKVCENTTEIKVETYAQFDKLEEKYNFRLNNTLNTLHTL